MGKQLFINNFETVFAGPVKDSPTSQAPATELDYGVLRLSDGAAAKLLNPQGGDYYLLTAFKRSGVSESAVEVLAVTAVDNAVVGECRITVTRAQDGTQAQAYVAGDRVEMRLSAAGARNFAQRYELDAKVDKVAGKGLSTEDYTAAEKSKLAGIEAGANAYVHPATHPAAVIVQDANNRFITDAEKSKLAGIAPGAQANVKADWNAANGDAQILNKPVLGTAAAKDAPATGNAGAAQVVLGGDSRLTDSRPASDVSAWAKAATKPSYTAAEVGLGNVNNTSDVDKPVSTAAAAALAAKQEQLVSGSNIKTVNGLSLLGSGDVSVSGAAPTNAMALTRTNNSITAITEDGVTTTIAYDAQGRVATVSYPRAGKTRTETYSYNGAGQLTGMSATEA